MKKKKYEIIESNNEKVVLLLKDLHSILDQYYERAKANNH